MSINDELFAIRIALQDSYPDEKDIIRELKIFLRNNNTPLEEINQKIIDFYKEFSIDFSEDFISSINMHNNIFSSTKIKYLFNNLKKHNFVQIDKCFNSFYFKRRK